MRRASIECGRRGIVLTPRAEHPSRRCNQLLAEFDSPPLHGERGHDRHARDRQLPRHRRTVCLIGDSGNGKTHLLLALELAASDQDRRVRYVIAVQLVNELVEATDDRRLSKIVTRYGRLDLLCLDLCRAGDSPIRGVVLLRTATKVLVGGETAFGKDFFDLTNRYCPIVFAFVLGMSFLLLAVVFRSIVVPIKAIIMNLLFVGAAYGLMFLVTQRCRRPSVRLPQGQDDRGVDPAALVVGPVRPVDGLPRVPPHSDPRALRPR
jgi:IstB-like ATP binding protein/MMPL family